MIAPDDEGIHPIEAHAHWQESYYFNWFDPAHEAFGLARIGYRFGERRIDGIVVAILDGRPHFIYPGVGLGLRGSASSISPAEGLRARDLSFEMEEPLSRWRLRLRGRNAMDLTWQAFTPPFDYAASGRAMPENLAADHFEQSGRVTGWTRFRGRHIEVDALGQRDKSWGVRDWARVEGWNWISAQFGQEIGFNAWETTLAGRRIFSGFVFRGGESRALEQLDVELDCPHRAHVPNAVRLRMVDASGMELCASGRAVGQCGLVKRGHFVQESPARFWLEWGGAARAGVGVIEHTWRAGAIGTLRRAPELLAVACRAMRL